MARVVPKYYEIEQALRRRITNMSVGDALPPEPVLAEECGVSRTTLRIALAALVEEGLLDRVQGRGTFVAAHKVEFPLNYHERSGPPEPDELVTHRVMSKEIRPAGPGLAALFECPEDESVFELERLSLFEETPVGFGHVAVPIRYVPDVQSADFTVGRFFYTLADLGLEIVRYRLAIESLVLGQDQARALGTRSGLPAIGLTRDGMDAEGRVVAKVEIITRGDLGRYVMELPTTAGGDEGTFTIERIGGTV